MTETVPGGVSALAEALGDLVTEPGGSGAAGDGFLGGLGGLAVLLLGLLALALAARWASRPSRRRHPERRGSRRRGGDVGDDALLAPDDPRRDLGPPPGSENGHRT